MAKEYLTIRRFAQLRGVNINSLRYYEKLKILVPAWIDPQTKYRYYLPEQLITLDTILLCIQLGIPLKTLREYMDENGSLKEKVILEKGKERLLSQISELQQGIELTEFQINSIEGNQKYSGQTGVYRRRIKERYLMETLFHPLRNRLGFLLLLRPGPPPGPFGQQNYPYPRGGVSVQTAGHNA